MRYSPDASTPCGWTAASNSCDTAVSMTSRELLRICRSARRRPAEDDRNRAPQAVVAVWRTSQAEDVTTRAAGVACHRVIVAESEVAHLTKILGRETRVHRCVEAVLRQIPTAAARHPCRLGQPFLDSPVVAPLHALADIEVAQVVPQDRSDPEDRVMDLSLDIDKQRVVPGPGVGPGHEEQIGVAVGADALVRLCSVGPLLGQ